MSSSIPYAPRGPRAAAAAGFELCTLAPIFPPGSKPGDTRPTIGIPGLSVACAGVPGFPVLALGGVAPHRVAPLLAAGAHGIAGITDCVAAIVERAFRQHIDADVRKSSPPTTSQIWKTGSSM